MNIYKIIFINNSVATCEILQRKVELNNDYSYDHVKGKLIYAIVRAMSEEEAIKKGEEIARQFKYEKFGDEYIN